MEWPHPASLAVGFEDAVEEDGVLLFVGEALDPVEALEELAAGGTSVTADAFALAEDFVGEALRTRASLTTC